MQLVDFVTAEEMADILDLPAQAAFMSFTTLAYKRLSERLAGVLQEPVSEADWESAQEARYGFMNCVVGAAKILDIEPIASMPIPKIDKFHRDDYRQFKADLDHCVTQLAFTDTARAKRNSVRLLPDLKEKIRTYVFHLKETIDKSGLSDSKKSALHCRLAAFEAELEKKRLDLGAVAMVALALLAAPAGIDQSADTVKRILFSMFREIGAAKDDEDLQRLIPGEPHKAISGPSRKDDDKSKRGSKALADLDDEIPF